MRGYSGNTIKRQAGYAYLALLILIAIIGVAAAATVQLGGIYRRRMAEKELLFIGGEFQRALASYGANTPLGQPDQPRTLDELVRDPRYPNPVHHLRKLYADPITGKADWLLVMSARWADHRWHTERVQGESHPNREFPAGAQGVRQEEKLWRMGVHGAPGRCDASANAGERCLDTDRHGSSYANHNADWKHNANWPDKRCDAVRPKLITHGRSFAEAYDFKKN